MGKRRSRSKVVKGEVSIDMDKLVESVRKEVEMLVPLSDKCCIYRVPPQFRELNEKAYTPRVVSIGPFHHGKKELKAMEEHKLRYMNDFLRRNGASLEEYMKDVQDLEISLRNSYAETIKYTREEFVKMMAVDGAFLVEFLLKWYFSDWPSNDRIFNKQQLGDNIRFDIVKLENQLPFFFLSYLLKLCNILENEEELSMFELIHAYLEGQVGWERRTVEELYDISKGNELQVQNFVDFLGIYMLPSKPRAGETYKSLTTPTISELHQAGVKFKVSSSKCLLDIKFDEGTLEIPKFTLTDHAEFYFRNMQAFEHCHGRANYIRDYIFIMDMLVNNSKDVELLVKNGIIENWLEDNAAAATFFNKLGKHNLITDEFFFSELVENLSAYCKNSWHNWRATLMERYFNNPWTIISVCAAAFLLILTIIQTVCSILQVVQFY